MKTLIALILVLCGRAPGLFAQTAKAEPALAAAVPAAKAPEPANAAAPPVAKAGPAPAPVPAKPAAAGPPGGAPATPPVANPFGFNLTASRTRMFWSGSPKW